MASLCTFFQKFIGKLKRISNKNLAWQKGILGEDLARRYLKKKGYKILERNWRSGRCEIDIIAKDRECIVFVEVRTRQENQLCSGYDSVNRHKKQMLKRGIKLYLHKMPFVKTFRLDIVSIDWIEGSDNYKLHHYENVNLNSRNGI
ncbi:MAG: YraN family protein [Puniceicoccales bacterium]|jgi:putative endonuclease|nr:YraN family protein [Puniceicoccales bacterium]